MDDREPVPANAAAARAEEARARLRALSFFVGDFACHGRAYATPMFAAHSVERRIAGAPDLDGVWLSMRFQDRRTRENPTPIRGNWQVGWDADAGTYVALWADNLGRWFSQTSAGWMGDTIEFIGGPAGAGPLVRDAFTRHDERSMTMEVDFGTEGAWRRAIELECIRLPA